MADGLKKEPVVILRIDGEDLKEFVNGTEFESEVTSMFSGMDSANATLSKSIMMALEQLTIEHGMPPSSDSLVSGSIVEPALQSLSTDHLEQPVSQEIFLEEFKKLLNDIILRLQERPVIVAHSENTFDGSGIKRLLSNKFELDKLLDMVWRDLPKDQNDKASIEQLRVALDWIAASADLPTYGTIDQVDAIVNEVFTMVNIDDKKIMQEVEFKEMMCGILGSLMSRLEGKPIFVSSSSVVHEPLASSSALLLSSSPSSTSSQSE